MIKERENLINNLIWFVDFVLAVGAYFISKAYLPVKSPITFFEQQMLLLLLIPNTFIALRIRNLAFLHRTRPYSLLFFNYLLYSIALCGFWVLESQLLGIHMVTNQQLLGFGMLNFVFVFICNFILFKTFKFVRKKGRNYRTAAIFAESNSIHFIDQMLCTPEWGYRLSCIISDDSKVKSHFKGRIKILPESIDVSELIDKHPIDEVFYWKENPDNKTVKDLITACSEVGVVFRLKSPFFAALFNKSFVHYFDTTPILTYTSTPADFSSVLLKRLFDGFFSLMAVLAFLPFGLLIALAIKLDSKGPIFFAQERVGLRGRRFKVLKFRTMVANAEELKAKLIEDNEVDGPYFKMKRDPRITRVGHILRKTSLDEMPQFLNVLFGDMSIVGPRPSLPNEIAEFDRWQLRRLSMKPGITCIWQVSGRNNIPFEEWMRMDLQYIDNWSFKLDMLLIAKTVRAVFRAEGQ